MSFEAETIEYEKLQRRSKRGEFKALRLAEECYMNGFAADGDFWAKQAEKLKSDRANMRKPGEPRR